MKAVAPFVQGPVLMETKPSTGQSRVGAPFIRGINAQIETNMSVLPNSIVDGKFDVSDRGLLVGTEFAHNMDLQVGDLVEIGSPSMLEAWGRAPKRRKLPPRCCRNTRCAGSSMSATTNTIWPWWWSRCGTRRICMTSTGACTG